jgi:hypothetical protein
MNDSEIYKELRGISTLNGWGVLGVLMPLVGLILYGIAFSRANTLIIFLKDNKNEVLMNEAKTRKTTARIMTFVLIFMILFYVVLGAAISNNLS